MIICWVKVHLADLENVVHQSTLETYLDAVAALRKAVEKDQQTAATPSVSFVHDLQMFDADDFGKLVALVQR